MCRPIEFDPKHTTKAFRPEQADSAKPRATHHSATPEVDHESSSITRVKGIKSAAIRLLPETVLRTYWRLRHRNYVYGLPTSADQIPDNDVWNTASWRSGDLRKFVSRYADRDLDLPTGSYVSEIASIIAAAGHPVHIVDFGGGNGSLFFALRKTRQWISSYQIYDDTSSAFEEAFIDVTEPEISLQPISAFFSTAATDDDIHSDILISNTTLQYCEDISSFINAAKRYNPKLIILTRFLAASPGNKAIVVPQHYPAGVTQCRYHDLE